MERRIPGTDVIAKPPRLFSFCDCECYSAQAERSGWHDSSSNENLPDRDHMTSDGDFALMNSDDSTIKGDPVPRDCPADDVLRRLLLGQFEDAELSSLEPHLSTCAACSKRLEQIREDDSQIRTANQLLDLNFPSSSITPTSTEWPTRFRNLLTGLKTTAAADPTDNRADDDASTTDATANTQHLRGAHDGNLKPGTRLGGYEIIRCLGIGGIGEVYLARQTKLDRRVALKVLAAKFTNDREALQRFEREMHAIARLDHPNVVHAYDADESRGIHFLVMEYVEGRDLHVVVRGEGPLKPARAIGFIIQAAEGLAAAHAQGIVHRDIKPSNLLLDRSGCVKVLDLGLARLDVGIPVDPSTELTTSGVIMGTVDYMAPEQGNDSRRADGRSDIYSLGCTLFFLLTGRSPYTGDGLLDRVVAHRLNEIPDIRTFCPDASDSLAAVLTRCLAKNPADRYSSMLELIAALKTCVDDTSSAESTRATNSRDDGRSGRAQVAAALNSTAISGTDVQTQFDAVSANDSRLRLVSRSAMFVIVVLLLIAGLVYSIRDHRGLTSPITCDSVQPEVSPGPKEPTSLSATVPPGATSQIVDGDWGVRAVKHPQLLEFLTTTGTVTPDGMRTLVSFPRLQHLEWNGPATDASMVSLAELTHLQVLRIAAGPEFTGSGLEHLRHCRELNFLKLDGSGLNDDGLLCLPELPLLSKLGINHTKVGDRGLARLARCSQLEQVAVHYCPAITDAGLVHFEGLDKLNALNLECCPQVTDAGLEHLAKIKSLVWVDVRGTGVTESGVQRFRSEHPRCQILFGASDHESPARNSEEK